MGAKQKILFHPKPFDHPTIYQTPNRTDRPILSQTVVQRDGMTTDFNFSRPIQNQLVLAIDGARVTCDQFSLQLKEEYVQALMSLLYHESVVHRD